MGLWERACDQVRGWWRRLTGQEVVRRVTRLEEVAPLDQVAETVSLRGPPARPGRRRLVLRDARLLPKRLHRRERRRKGVVILPAEEARRLFAGTLRTTNRQIRDLLPDRAQLARYDLPVWESEADLAQALGISVGELRFLAIHRLAERQPHYVTFAIPKRGGGERLITAPKRRLKAVQRRLCKLLIDRLPVSEHAHGFRAGRSVASHAAEHVGRAVVVKLDLADFFHTVTYPRVRGYLIALGYGFPVAATLAVLLTEAERQRVDAGDAVFHVPIGPRRCVQGAPTSPGVCNAIAHKLDRRLAGLGRALGWTYTRYADDLTFSSDDPATLTALLRQARVIVEDEGFHLNHAKTRVLRRGQRQRVTGVTVNEVLGISRTERRRLRAMLHQHGDDPAWRDRLEGALGWVAAVNPEQAERLRARWKR